MTEITEFEARRLGEGDAIVLGDGTVDLWAFRVDRTRDADWQLLDSAERAAAERVIVPRKRVQKVASRAALRRLLSAYTGRPANAIRFRYGEHDKPELDDQSLCFNLSHSFDWATVAIAREGRVGVDVERVERRRPFMEIAQRFFNPDEQRDLEGLQADQRADAFYRAWTRKEAYLKAWGTGLTFASSRFCIDFCGGGPGHVRHTEMPGDDPHAWRFVDIRVAEGYPAALCWDREPRAVRAFRHLDADERAWPDGD